MNANHKSTFDSILLLSAGIGFGLLIAVGIYTGSYFTKTPEPVSAPPEAVASQPVNVAPIKESEWKEVPLSQPTLTDAAPQSVAPSSGMIAAPVAGTAGMIAQPQTVQQSNQQAPIEVVGNALQAASTGMLAPVNNSYADGDLNQQQINPSWTITRNGLIGNPPVDPPTSKGRAYRSDNSY